VDTWIFTIVPNRVVNGKSRTICGGLYSSQNIKLISQ